MLFADLCAADGVSAKPRVLDEFARKITFGSFKSRACAGVFERLFFKAWSEACKYLSSIGMDVVKESDKKIWAYVKERMDRHIFSIVPGGNENSSMVSFVVNSMHPHDVADIALLHNFEIRTGHMCAQSALDNLGFKSLCRLSWGIGSDTSDVEAFIRLIEEECLNER